MNSWCFLVGATVVRGAFAQSGDATWIVEVSSGVVSPANPSVIVRLLARFPQSDYAWASGGWDVLAGEGEWSNLTRLLTHNLAPSLGTVQQGDVLDIRMGQFNFQPEIADPANPIPVWQGTWTATDFRPRDLEFSTQTRVFAVYPVRWSAMVESRLSIHDEGSAIIRVVPAPSAILVLMPVLRRRRR